jgi:hypothetical protein
MNINKYIDFKYFIISFAIGLFFVYILGSDQHIIYVYPTPDNYTSVMYKDNADQCFQYKAQETDCPMNPLLIKTIPIQT